MTDYREQVEGDIAPGRGFDIVRVLSERKGLATHLTLRSGEALVVTAISFGRDIGAAWEHLYFDADGKSYFLSTSEVAALTEPESGAVLYKSA